MSATSEIWTAGLIIIGDEILSGRTEDQNISQVASWLKSERVQLSEVRVVPDVIDCIVEAIQSLCAGNTYVFTTGGIGPTHDDVTVDAVAKALEVPVIVHPTLRGMLEEYFAEREGELTDGRLRLARAPQGAELIPNRKSFVPGFRIANIIMLAGVPNLAAGMLDGLAGKLRPV